MNGEVAESLCRAPAVGQSPRRAPGHLPEAGLTLGTVLGVLPLPLPRRTQAALVIFMSSSGSDLGEFTDYDPNLLDDPQWPCGKHKRVLIFPSYMVSIRAGAAA